MKLITIMNGLQLSVNLKSKTYIPRKQIQGKLVFCLSDLKKNLMV